MGNGPSLKDTNLDLLKGEVCFGVNRIHLIYPYTRWRPTYWIRTEGYAYDEEDILEGMKIHFGLGCTCYLEDGLKGYVASQRRYMRGNCREEYLHLCHQVNYDTSEAPDHWHLPTICGFGSSVNVAIQIAVKEGFDEIYLVGCDLGYKDGKSNHFDPEYEIGYQRKARYANNNTLRAHKIAMRDSPIPIYNCTIGGNLDVYPRMRMEDVLNAGR
jgi:hypothetical protein